MEEGVQHFKMTCFRPAQTLCSRTIGQMLRGALVASTLFLNFIFMGTFVVNHWTDVSIIAGDSLEKALLTSKSHKTQRDEFTLKCFPENTTQTCPRNPPATFRNIDSPLAEACPEYFRWIHEDLRPWAKFGISKDMVESAKSSADIRVVVVNGTVYVEKYREVYETRDVFTVWGILQLMRMYPGKLPDLDLMFQCNDKPVINKHDYRGLNSTKVPPLFHYCADDSTFDIVFPDWSFWGWPEINIKPWESLKKELEEGNHRSKWMEREAFAFWKGNVLVSDSRQELVKCNITDEKDWKARIYDVTWSEVHQKGFKDTNLANQCTHRYKIYVEGVAWSVSEKYILACDSMSLLMTPHYYDFFTRSLIPRVHYWPINENDICNSIKFAVDWGNKHTDKAQEIGKAGSKFIQEELKMKYVYDYMFHLLNGYAKLLKYKPTVPPEATEVCSETLACSATGLDKKFTLESMVKSPADTSPCTTPPPYSSTDLHKLLVRKSYLIKKVEMWEASGTFETTD